MFKFAIAILIISIPCSAFIVIQDSAIKFPEDLNKNKTSELQKGIDNSKSKDATNTNLVNLLIPLVSAIIGALIGLIGVYFHMKWTKHNQDKKNLDRAKQIAELVSGELEQFLFTLCRAFRRSRKVNRIFGSIVNEDYKELKKGHFKTLRLLKSLSFRLPTVFDALQAPLGSDFDISGLEMNLIHNLGVFRSRLLNLKDEIAILIYVLDPDKEIEDIDEIINDFKRFMHSFEESIVKGDRLYHELRRFLNKDTEYCPVEEYNLICWKKADLIKPSINT